MSEDGAWSWFSDPRSFYTDGVVHAGWVTSSGDVQVGTYGIFEGEHFICDLEPEFGPDDHDYPAFCQTADGRYTAFYAGHAVYGTHNLYRTGVSPCDFTVWCERDSTDVNTYGGAGVTYSNPYAVPGTENQYFLFWRGGDWKPAYAVGTYYPGDALWEWSLRGRLITVPSGRPYVKYATDGDRVAIAFTDGHPSETPSNIYYAEIREHGLGTHSFFHADGTVIKPMNYGALSPAEADTVFDRLADPEHAGDNSWVWDVAFDEDGMPVVAFASFPSRTEHQYHWARFDGSSWQDQPFVGDSGGSVADTTVMNPQYYYSGGIALDPVDPSITYVSIKNELGGSDLQRRVRGPDGKWSIHEIAGGTRDDNMRPNVPRGRPEGTEMVLWMSGTYDYYANTYWQGMRVNPDSLLAGAVAHPADCPLASTAEKTIYYSTAIKLWMNAATTSVCDAAIPEVSLLPARPNPFHRATEISYSLAEPGRATICVYDLSGRLVRTVLDAALPAGTGVASWDGRDGGGRDVASGVYFVRLSAGGVTTSRRCVLIR